MRLNKAEKACLQRGKRLRQRRDLLLRKDGYHNFHPMNDLCACGMSKVEWHHQPVSGYFSKPCPVRKEDNSWRSSPLPSS